MLVSSSSFRAIRTTRPHTLTTRSRVSERALVCAQQSLSLGESPVLYELNEWIGKVFAIALITGGAGYGLWYVHGEYRQLHQDLRSSVESQQVECEAEFATSNVLEQQQSWEHIGLQNGLWTGGVPTNGSPD